MRVPVSPHPHQGLLLPLFLLQPLSGYKVVSYCGFDLYFLFLKYLFIWLRRVLVVAHGTFVAMCRIFSCSMWALSCGMRDLVPWPGIKPTPPALVAQRLIHWTTREVPVFSEWLMMLSIFSCAYWPFVYLLWRNMYSSPWTFKNWVICLFVVEF